MPFFDSAQQTLARGLSVYYAELVRVSYRTSTGYYWDGFGQLVAYGDTWLGAAQAVQRSEIPFGVNDEAGKLTLTLSGVDAAIVSKVLANISEFYGRELVVWGQFFDDNLQLSGSRFELFRGTMDVPTYSGSGPGQRAISIPCEGEWNDRNGAALSFFSDRDQKKRFPGAPLDRGLEYVYRYMPGVVRTWPVF